MRAGQEAFRLRAKAKSLATDQLDGGMRGRGDTLATAAAHAAVMRRTTGVGTRKACAEELCGAVNVDTRIRYGSRRVPGLTVARVRESTYGFNAESAAIRGSGVRLCMPAVRKHCRRDQHRDKRGEPNPQRETFAHTSLYHSNASARFPA
jgi:hypothetical protein